MSRRRYFVDVRLGTGSGADNEVARVTDVVEGLGGSVEEVGVVGAALRISFTWPGATLGPREFIDQVEACLPPRFSKVRTAAFAPSPMHYLVVLVAARQSSDTIARFREFGATEVTVFTDADSIHISGSLTGVAVAWFRLGEIGNGGEVATAAAQVKRRIMLHQFKIRDSVITWSACPLRKLFALELAR